MSRDCINVIQRTSVRETNCIIQYIGERTINALYYLNVHTFWNRNVSYSRALNLFPMLCLICFSLIIDVQFFIGAIEVRLATMSKLDRSNATEVYTMGFVPSYSSGTLSNDDVRSPRRLG